MTDWRRVLRADPLPWLLEKEDPAPRHMALRLLLDHEEDDPVVKKAQRKAMGADPIAAILGHQQAEGFWLARSVTGEGFSSYYRSGTSGPGFACAINGGLPCAWGAIKALRGLARIPHPSPLVRRAIDLGVESLLSRDPAVAEYPTSSHISPNWFKLGFPSGYVADLLQNLETLAELGRGDPTPCPETPGGGSR